jgi:flagellar basal-body rod protein FlgC
MALSLYSALDVAASGLNAQRTRMNTIASNLANARTTRGADGGPYRRIDPVFEAVPISRTSELERNVAQVRVKEIRQDDRPGQMVYDPGHPDANAQGYVEYPNVNVVEEMANMMSASRSYEAGVAAIESIKAMARAATGIGR